ncbi:lytic transglycosylase domain-containing protein [Alkaliphilus serpentinus]|uniref:Transglycosylase SLT domain-containing protein n=1 Tax=Alkaliphilus serpentinus TaxID=1482731 RepID=A0A833HPQ5_9FIRM|nr:lytic transglycosylase domain-containing protein [Alkaliphilus serpentinus]KAB3531140.1 transglycosylase SLT domain-containing protein [Alkaliphilus serpentinus]
MKLLKAGIICLLIIVIVLAVMVFRDRIQSVNIIEVQADPYSYDVKGAVEEYQLLEKLREDNSEAAIEKLKSLVDLKNATGYRANIILAEKLKGRGEDYTSHYKRALDLFVNQDLQFSLAEGLMEWEYTQEAIEAYINLLPAEDAIGSLLQLGKNKWEIARQLIVAKHFTAATEYLQEELQDSENDPLYKSLYALLLTSSGDYDAGLEIFQDIKEVIISDKEIYWWYGRALETVGKLEEAMAVYEDLDGKGSYRFGLLLEGLNRNLEAANAYVTSDSDVSLWRGARLLDELNRKEEALEVYKRLAYMEGSYHEDSAYRAYILQKELQKPVDEEIVNLLKKSPAWSAAIGVEPQWPSLQPSAFRRPEFLQRYEDYLDEGLLEMANIEHSIGEKFATNQEKLYLGRENVERAQYYRGVIWGIRAIREEPTLEGYQLAYQRPFEELVMKAAEEFQIDPYLIWAVMREESHYRPEVFSRVGAVGLMQIMPATGEDIASRLKVDFNDSHLLNPEINIRFGAYYIKLMLNSFEGDMDRALAAYNGGPGNVRKWSRTHLGSTKEGFPTAITFLETRRYITKVKNSYYTYKWLYQE